MNYNLCGNYKNYENFGGLSGAAELAIKASKTSAKSSDELAASAAKNSSTVMNKSTDDIASAAANSAKQSFKSGATTGSRTYMKATADNIKYFTAIAAKNPKLTAVGLTAAGIAIYADINNISFSDATGQLINKTEEELTPIVKELAEAAGTVVGAGVGAVIEGGGAAVGGGINALIASLTGIPKEFIPYIWYSLVGIIVLLIIYRIYKIFN
jgi:hypothetical protein